ncbi:TetR/AcrR family transcriptional regulator [Nonomuraea sp. NPDC050556]|uniref:TetR/AcrR family transcriptional regulator n=1 Tax=Nonomuraea sp. NPDC050556 TaxID=3364369 RepID=UPI0037B8F10D
MTRAESKAANRRALIDAARDVVGRYGSQAKLEDIAELAGLTTGAVYSLFGGKNDLMVAMVDDYAGPLDLADIDSGLPVEEVVAEIARRFRRMSADPEAAGELLFETRVLDLALNDPTLLAKLSTSIRSTEARFAELVGDVRLARALKALLSGLGQGLVLGVHDASEEFFVEAAQALIQVSASATKPGTARAGSLKA